MVEENDLILPDENQHIIGQDVSDLNTVCGDIVKSFLYYNESDDVQIFYISDLHLDSHLCFYASKQKMIADIVDRLYLSLEKQLFGSLLARWRFGAGDTAIVFAGDISYDGRLVIDFFKSFMQKYKYQRYLDFKSKYSASFGMTGEQKIQQLRAKCDALEKEIAKREKALRKLGVRKLSGVCGYGHHIPYNCSEYVKFKVSAVEKLFHKYNNKLSELNAYLSGEPVWGKSLLQLGNDIPLSVNHFDVSQSLSHIAPVFLVLGNHEYVMSSEQENVVVWYKQKLETFGVRVLHNEAVSGEACVIYGGTGVPKYYVDEFCVNKESDSDEEETDFEIGYKKALAFAKSNNLAFICVSHYSPRHCLSHTDREAIYISGHTHKNEFIRSPNLVLYADNQVGYKSMNISFRYMQTGHYTNPYVDLDDGAHETNLDSYVQFMRYADISCGGLSLLEKRCAKGQLYVLKCNGYYGFFIVKPNAGISIVYGGRTKRVTTSVNIDWIYRNFDALLQRYLSAMLPLRVSQQKVSDFLQNLGFSGRIHGAIVDIDFENHIMFNPVDGNVIFYYSPGHDYGRSLLPFDSFEALLLFNQKRLACSVNTYELELVNRTLNCLQALQQNGLTEDESLSVLVKSQNLIQVNPTDDMIEVDKRTGLYALSRFISPLQRLFSSRVLQVFDVCLVDDVDETQKLRTTSYFGRVCSLDDVDFLVISDGLRDVLVLQNINDKTVKRLSVFRMKDLCRQNALKWLTMSAKETRQRYPNLIQQLALSDVSDD